MPVREVLVMAGATGSSGNSRPARRRLFGPLSRAEGSRLADALRGETVGGVLLLAGAALALAWANSPWSETYVVLRDSTVGPDAVHLNLTVGAWAADGLLAVFFFVAGLEVKREFVAGDLRDPRRAALPVVAAVGGVVTPLALYLMINTRTGGDPAGWAVPIATDIAFALAVLAVTASYLPAALRTFLLTLAVVDDLIAITIIAIFFTDELQVAPLLLAAVPLALFGWLIRRERAPGWLLVPLAVTVWALVHACGVHATVAGVLLAFTVPVARGPGGENPASAAGPVAAADPVAAAGPVAAADPVPAGPSSRADRLEHRLRPWSAGVAVPVFALFAAGVSVNGTNGIRSVAADPVALGVVVGLLVGKPVGVFGAAWLTARLTRAELDTDLSWADVAGAALLSGIGFTVSLLIGELAFGVGTARDDHIKIAVLTGSTLSAVAATAVLRLRNRVHRARGTGDDEAPAAQAPGH